MSETKHTPTPWRWGPDWDELESCEEDAYRPPQKYMTLQLFGSDGSEVIPIRIDHHSYEWDTTPAPDVIPTKADRDFIIEAVNAYDDLRKQNAMLLAACEAAKAEFVNVECDSDGRYFGEAAVIDALDAAINAARGMK